MKTIMNVKKILPITEEIEATEEYKALILKIKSMIKTVKV
jgi:hypothetical protein